MSIKHVKEYYNKINDDFDEMIETLHEMEQAATEGIVSPERLDSIKQMVEPMKLNKARWDYMMFLLNLPNKKAKKDYYIKHNGKIVENINMISMQEHEENQECIKNLSEQINKIK